MIRMLVIRITSDHSQTEIKKNLNAKKISNYMDFSKAIIAWILFYCNTNT